MSHILTSSVASRTAAGALALLLAGVGLVAAGSASTVGSTDTGKKYFSTSSGSAVAGKKYFSTPSGSVVAGKKYQPGTLV